jgi:hypothetical protein
MVCILLLRKGTGAGHWVVYMTPFKFMLKFILKRKEGWVLVAHACNPSYLGDRDQEDGSLKPARGNSSRAPMWKIPNTKRAGGVAPGVGPEFKPQYPHQGEKGKDRRGWGSLS